MLRTTMGKFAQALICSCIFYGCIKPAPLSPEADIETFSIDSAYLNINTINVDQGSRTISIYMKSDYIDSPMAPIITITKGATISPASGEKVVFNKPVQYVVTSEDGKNKKTYTAQAVPSAGFKYEFEDWVTLGDAPRTYQHPVEKSDNGAVLPIWSSGNPGLTIVVDPPYPTRATTDAFRGDSAAELETMRGQVLFGLGAPLSTGSLFLGSFILNIGEPLKSTQFGQPFEKGKKPIKFTGYYKYSAGATYAQFSLGAGGKIETTPIPGKTDSCAIYVVIFRGAPLDGTNVTTSDRIVAMAELKDGLPQSQYTSFDIPFEYYADVDWKNENLLFSVVFSSSKGGNDYRGALGSKLRVDHVEVVCEDVP